MKKKERLLSLQLWINAKFFANVQYSPSEQRRDPKSGEKDPIPTQLGFRARLHRGGHADQSCLVLTTLRVDTKAASKRKDSVFLLATFIARAMSPTQGDSKERTSCV